jgi:hypothetical protein
MGFPPRDTNAFPGKRVDPYRDGITTTTCGSLITASAPMLFRDASTLPLLFRFGHRYK